MVSEKYPGQDLYRSGLLLLGQRSKQGDIMVLHTYLSQPVSPAKYQIPTLIR